MKARNRSRLKHRLASVPAVVRLFVAAPLAAALTVAQFLGLGALRPASEATAASPYRIFHLARRDSQDHRRVPTAWRFIIHPMRPELIELAHFDKEGEWGTDSRSWDVNEQLIEPSIDLPRFQRVIADHRRLQPIVRVEVRYPAIALEQELEGWCDMRFDIDPDGSVSAVSAKCSDVMFKEAAETALRQWRYRPLVVNGQPLARRNRSERVEFRIAD